MGYSFKALLAHSLLVNFTSVPSDKTEQCPTTMRCLVASLCRALTACLRRASTQDQSKHSRSFIWGQRSQPGLQLTSKVGFINVQSFFHHWLLEDSKMSTKANLLSMPHIHLHLINLFSKVFVDWLPLMSSSVKIFLSAQMQFQKRTILKGQILKKFK